MILRILLAAVAVCLAGPAAAQTKISLGYTQANAFMAAFVAKDQGFFAKRGLDVTMQIVPQGSRLCPSALLLVVVRAVVVGGSAGLVVEAV